LGFKSIKKKYHARTWRLKNKSCRAGTIKKNIYQLKNPATSPSKIKWSTPKSCGTRR